MGRPNPAEERVRSRIITVIAAIAAASLGLVGCASVPADVGSDPNNPNQVEVFTWWASGSEKASFEELVGEFEKQNPSLQFIDASVRGTGGDQARAAIAARLDASNPPDTFLATAGAALTDYIADGDLQDLTGFYEENGLSSGVYRSALLDLLSVNGKIYSVPVDIHRVNVMWTNNSVLRSAGIDPAVVPTSIETWITDLEKVRQSGVEYPLALGNDLTQVQLFENVLVSDLGAVLYQNLWKSKQNWDGAAIRKAIEHFSQLLEYTDPDTRSDDWVASAQSVVEGDAAYILMADYALSTFQQVSLITGDEHSAVPMPGTVGIFDFVADSFTLPVGVVHNEAAEAWLLTASSADGQKALCITKGSIPARTDTIKAEYPPYQQTAIEALKLDTVVPSLAHGVAANPSWTKAITQAVAKFVDDGHPEALVNGLIKAAEKNLVE